MRTRWLFFWLVACSTQTVYAQGNELHSPSGGRSALMGGTGVALARDSAAPFYNPATIIRIVDRRLAFSVNFYSLSFLSFSRLQSPGSVDRDYFGDTSFGSTGLVDTSFRTLPTTLCLFFTLSDLAKLAGEEDADADKQSEPMPGSKLAVCFASLESEDFDLQAIRFTAATGAGGTQHLQSLGRRWSRHYIGPTYSTYLARDLAFGASLQVVYTHTAFGIDSTSLSDRLGGGTIASNFGASGSGYSFDLAATVGATYKYRDWTFGASVRAPSLHAFGSYNGTFNRSTQGSDEDEALATSGHGSMRAAVPLRAALGVGVHWGRLTLELDGALNVPFTDELRSKLTETEFRSTGAGEGVSQAHDDVTYKVSSHATFNPSFGAEYFTSNDFSVLAGISANFSALDALRPAESVGNLVQARTSHISGAVGMGSYWDGGELLFGFQLDYGWGQTLAVNAFAVPNAWSVVSMQSYALTFIIAGATNVKSIARVVRHITGNDDDDEQKK